MFAKSTSAHHQHTLQAAIECFGIGLHSGQHACLRIDPAPVNQGIRLIRSDLPAGEGEFAVHWSSVARTELSTSLSNPDGHSLATVEHLLAALMGMGIDNATVTVDGPEVPILDGSAAPYVRALLKVGLQPQPAWRKRLVVRRPVRVQQGQTWAELLPHTQSRFSLCIDFPHTDIDVQCYFSDLSRERFQRDIAPARTFGFAEDLYALRKRGLALGGSMANAIVLGEGKVRNPEGLRFADEFVRHKLLDAIGDLALVGMPIVGHFRSYRPGHRINTNLLNALMQEQGSWDIRGGGLVQGIHSDWLTESRPVPENIRPVSVACRLADVGAKVLPFIKRAKQTDRCID